MEPGCNFNVNEGEWSLKWGRNGFDGMRRRMERRAGMLTTPWLVGKRFRCRLWLCNGSLDSYPFTTARTHPGCGWTSLMMGRFAAFSGRCKLSFPGSLAKGWPNCPRRVKFNRLATHVDVPSISFSDPGSTPGVSTNVKASIWNPDSRLFYFFSDF